MRKVRASDLCDDGGLNVHLQICIDLLIGYLREKHRNPRPTGYTLEQKLFVITTLPRNTPWE